MNYLNQKIAISSRRSIKPNEVIMLVSDSNYSRIYFENSKCLTVAKTLKELATAFENHFSFVRTHKSYLVNIDFIKEITWGKSEAYITLANNYRATIARRNRVKIKGLI